MPLPVILLWGAAALLGAVGVKKGLSASGNFNRAKSIGEHAQGKYADKVRETDKQRKSTQKKLESLGKLKVSVFTSDIKFMVDALRKGRSKLSEFDIVVTVEQLKEYERLVIGSLEIEKGLASGAAGGALAAMGAYGAVGSLATASTGAAISGLTGVAATNATLAWLGGGALSAGGLGMTGGMVALGGVVVGPALAIGGFILAGRAEEALTRAHAYSAKIDKTTAELGKVDLELKAIRANCTELAGVISKLSEAFNRVKVHDPRDKDFKRMLVVGMSLKQSLEIPVMDKAGGATQRLKSKYSGLLRVAGPEVPEAKELK